ncbi:MAG: HlyD family secretion protein [Vulcanimicrobiaceae bacterium]
METKESTTAAPRPTNGPSAPPADSSGSNEAKPTKARGPSGPARQVLIVAGVIVVLLVLFYGIRFIAYATTHQSTDDAYVEADIVTVTSKISERVQTIYTDTNRYVKKGDLLIQLDDQDENTRYAQALAAYHSEQATANAAKQNLALTRQLVVAQTTQGKGGVSSAQSGVSNAQQNVSVAQDGVNQARSQLSAANAAVPAAREALAKADADNRRTASLVSTGDVAQSDLDATRAELQQARAQYQEAQDNVRVAQSALSSAVQKVSAAESQVGIQLGQLTTAQGTLAANQLPQRVSVQSAQTVAAGAQAGSLAAQLRTARDQLSYTKIYAPISGYIGQKSVDLGQQVGPGAALLTIVPLNAIYITANFKETQMGSIRVGDQTDISVDAYPGVRFSGKVATVSPASQNEFALVPAQNATGNFVKVTQRIPVRIYVDSASKPLDQVPLRPGMSVVASVKVK